MVLVNVGPVVVLTTSHTTTTGMLPVLSDTSVTGGNVTAVLAGVAQSGDMLEVMCGGCACGSADLVGMLTAVELVS
jgi:hypothetical protein